MWGRLPVSVTHRAGYRSCTARLAFLVSLPVAYHCLWSLGFQTTSTRGHPLAARLRVLRRVHHEDAGASNRRPAQPRAASHRRRAVCPLTGLADAVVLHHRRPRRLDLEDGITHETRTHRIAAGLRCRRGRGRRRADARTVRAAGDGSHSRGDAPQRRDGTRLRTGCRPSGRSPRWRQPERRCCRASHPRGGQLPVLRPGTRRARRHRHGRQQRLRAAHRDRPRRQLQHRTSPPAPPDRSPRPRSLAPTSSSAQCIPA